MITRLPVPTETPRWRRGVTGSSRQIGTWLLWALVTVPSVATAQRITWVPHAGLYTGLTRQVDSWFAPVCPFRPPCYPGGNVRSRILPSPLVGITLLTQTDGVGFEVSLTGVQARIHGATLTDGDSVWRRSPGSPAMAGAVALRAAVSRPIGADRVLGVAVGVAVVSLGDQVSHGRAHAGPTISARLVLPSAGRRHLHVGATSMFYSVRHGSDRRIQHDLLLFVGWGLEARR